MNYFKARQRKDGRFDYTCMNDGAIWPVGYCRPYKPFGEKDLWIFHGSKKHMEEENEKLAKYASKHHGDGHATADEACACYRAYRLDQDSRLVKVEQKDADELRRCAICNDWCCSYGSVGSYSRWDLCEKHLTRESLEQLYDVGESWES